MAADVPAAATLVEMLADQALNSAATLTRCRESAPQPARALRRGGADHPLQSPAVLRGGRKVTAPLIAGNAVVLKTPDQTPLSGLRMAELAAEVFGPDLCAVISGRGAVSGAALVATH